MQPSKPVMGNRIERTYTYDDLLLMRLIVRLKEQGAKPRNIRKALDTIAYMGGNDRNAWKRSRILVSDGVIAVILQDPGMTEWNPVAASRGSQKMAEVFFPELIKELRNDLVPRERFKHIEVDPDVLGGAPVIKGTRVSTRAVMSVLESGGNPKEAYPTLTDSQIAEVKDYEQSFLLVA